MQKEEGQDWPQHKMMIMDRLERIEQQQKDATIETRALSDRVHDLQFEAAQWGAMAGLIPAVIVIVLTYLKFHNLLKCGKE